MFTPNSTPHRLAVPAWYGSEATIRPLPSLTKRKSHHGKLGLVQHWLCFRFFLGLPSSVVFSYGHDENHILCPVITVIVGKKMGDFRFALVRGPVQSWSTWRNCCILFIAWPYNYSKGMLYVISWNPHQESVTKPLYTNNLLRSKGQPISAIANKDH